MNIITLGPIGTYSHEAAKSLFTDKEITFAPNFEILFDAVGSGSHVGFVPFENSLHGSVVEVHDLIVETDVQVWQMHDVAIEHALGATNGDIVTIASHSQAWAQCRRYLKEHYPNAERFPVSSTGYAIDLALADPTVAAIASKSAMEEAGLPVIVDQLEENGNLTRFAVIANEDPFPDTERSEMGLVFHMTGDKPGLLHDILSPFKIYNVNLTKIENRPTGKGIGDYHFFLHLVGTLNDARTQQTLKEIEEMEGVEIVKIMGTW